MGRHKRIYPYSNLVPELEFIVQIAAILAQGHMAGGRGFTNREIIRDAIQLWDEGCDQYEKLWGWHENGERA